MGHSETSLEHISLPDGHYITVKLVSNRVAVILLRPHIILPLFGLLELQSTGANYKYPKKYSRSYPNTLSYPLLTLLQLFPSLSITFLTLGVLVVVLPVQKVFEILVLVTREPQRETVPCPRLHLLDLVQVLPPRIEYDEPPPPRVDVVSLLAVYEGESTTSEI